MRVILPSFFIFIALFLCNACHDSFKKNDRKKTFASEQIVRINMLTDPATLDPRKYNDIHSKVIIQMLFDGLTRQAKDDKIVPSIAEHFDVSEDFKTYTFYLREDCYWSNNDPVTAHDFIYTWRQILSPSFESPFSHRLFIIKNAKKAKEGKVPLEQIGIYAKDSKTLQVELEESTPYFPAILSKPIFFPINSNIDKKFPNWATSSNISFCSNGPFKLTKWEYEKKIEVSKNPKYWDAKNVHLEGISISLANTEKEQIEMFQNNKIDWLGFPFSPFPHDDTLEMAHITSLGNIPVTSTYCFIFNVNRYPFNNIKLRRALSYGINRQEIVTEHLLGSETAATSLVPTVAKLADSSYFEENDFQMAKQLFEEALEELNIPKYKLPTLKISVYARPFHESIATEVARQWSNLFGIKVKVEPQNWKQYLGSLSNKDFTISHVRWTINYKDPIDFLEAFKSTDAIDNFTGWENEVFTNLLEKSTQVVDPRRRRNILRMAENILIQESPITPLFHGSSPYLKKPWLKDVVVSELNNIDFKWSYIETGD